MQQPCYTTADVASHFSERPGKVLDQPALGWGFTVSVNGSIPLSPVTTWNGGVHTGTNVPQSDWYAMQRGDARTSGSEQADILTGRSMLQLNCNSAGIMLNNFWLDPVANEATAGGPQAAYSTVFRFNDDRPKLNISSGLLNTLQTYQPGRFSTGAAVHRPFATLGTSFVMDAYVVAPAFYISAANASYMPGGQMSYFVYFWDTKSGNSFAVLFALWATKDVAGTAGVGHDGNTFFVGQRVGGSAPFGMWLAGSAADWTPSVTFSTDRHFSIKITRDHLVTAIAAINATPGSGTPLSTDPADYVLTDVGYQAEIAFPNMSMGASVRNFSAYLTRY